MSMSNKISSSLQLREDDGISDLDGFVGPTLLPHRGDTCFDGVISGLGFGCEVPTAKPSTVVARMFRTALIAGAVGIAISFGHSTPAPAGDATTATETTTLTEAVQLLAELQSAAKALNDIAGRAPQLVTAMFDGKSAVKDVLALSAQSDVAQARLEKAFVAVKSGNALSIDAIRRIEELATTARTSALPVRSDTKTLEVVVRTAGILGGADFTVRRTPTFKQKEGIAAAQQAARDVDTLTKAILGAAVPALVASASGAPNSDPKIGMPEIEPKRDRKAEAEAAAAKAAAALIEANEARAIAKAAQAKAARTQKDLDGLAAAAKRLLDQQANVAKLKARIGATSALAFMNKIALTNTLINELSSIANQLTAISRNPLASQDRGALTTIASRMNGQIRVMRDEMSSLIPDESKVRSAGAVMEKMEPAIDKLVSEIFAKAAAEVGKLQALTEDAMARASAKRINADELSIAAQNYQRRTETLAELPEPRLVAAPARAANPAGRVPAFAMPSLGRAGDPASAAASSIGDADAIGR